MDKICIFAGTSEGRTLVRHITGRGVDVTVCVATEYGAELLHTFPVAVKTGRMDAEAMTTWLQAEHFSVVIDATHPYADQASANIEAACKLTDTECLRCSRAGTPDTDDSLHLADVPACIAYLERTEGPILLTTGTKDLPAFCASPLLLPRLYARILPVPSSLQVAADCGIAPDHIIAMQGPFSAEMNLAMLHSTCARYLVTKDTGSAGGYTEKATAARSAGAVLITIDRPQALMGIPLKELIGLLEARFSLAPMKKSVTLAGIGMGNRESRTHGLDRAIAEADCLIGAKRMLEAVDCSGKETFAAFDATTIAQYIENSPYHAFTVLLSGDTGFYSGARQLVSALAGMQVSVLPGISSLQYFFSKIAKPWESVKIISLHGNDTEYLQSVATNPAVFFLLGGNSSACSVLARLDSAGFGALPAMVGERLGYDEETLTHGQVSILARGVYDSLSVLYVENPGWKPDIVTSGLPDHWFERNETPMTKSEVRAISLSKLMLTTDAVVYDVGSGTGSVSVEIARLARAGTVYAIERKPEASELTRQNVRKFHLQNVQVIEGTAPDAFDSLPAPTHAFLGGTAGNLEEIVHALLNKNPDVRIVANAVTMETTAALHALYKTFQHSDIAEIMVSRPRPVGSYSLMTAQNPVYIFAFWNGPDSFPSNG